MTMRITSLAVLAALVGCASSAPPPPRTAPVRRPADAPAERPTVVTTAFDYRGVVLVDRRDSIILTLPDGGRQVQRMSRHVRLSLTVERDGDLRLRLDSVAYVPSAGANERDAVGTNWIAELRPGEGVRDVRADRRSAIASEIGEMIRDLLPALPRDGASTGSTWADTSASRRQVEIFEARDERVSRWSAGRVTTRSGVQLLPVTRSATYTQLGEGSQAGREMRMSSEGRSTTTYYLTAGGLVDEIEISDDATRLITIPSTRQAIPTRQVVRTTVRFEYP